MTFTMSDYEFTIPLENIAVYANQSGTYYCQMQIGLLRHSSNSVVLGSAFFTAFVGMFDTENDRLGFAESTRPLPGSSIRCVGKSCQSTPLNPDGTPIEPLPDKETSTTSKNVIFLIIALISIAILVCGVVYWCKKRSARESKP